MLVAVWEKGKRGKGGKGEGKRGKGIGEKGKGEIGGMGMSSVKCQTNFVEVEWLQRRGRGKGERERRTVYVKCKMSNELCRG